MQEELIEQLYNQHYKGLLGFFLKNFNKNLPLAEDLTQDTFAKIVRHQACHIGFVYSKQYVYKIAQNIKYDYIRRNKGLPTLDVDTLNIPLLIEFPIIDTYKDYIPTLQPAEKALLDLLYEGYNSFELAKIFNVTPSAIRARIAKLKTVIKRVSS